jgi:hypothetical protein
MDSEARHPDTPGRLRVVDLRIGSERRRLHLGGGFACVVAATGARSAAARWIASTIVGPAPTPSGSDSPSETAPEWRLQAPLLPLRAPAVLDRAVLQTLWRSDCARRLEVIAASRESLRSERERITAALERLRIQPPLTAARPRRASDQAGAELAAFRDSTRRFVRVQSLLGAIDALRPESSPSALELAAAWDARDSWVEPEARAEPEAPGETPPAPASASPTTPSDVDEQRRAELERLHRAVVKAEARIFGRRVLMRKRAVARYNAATGAERAALAGAGVDSYAEFLLESGAPELPENSPGRASHDESTAATGRDAAEGARPTRDDEDVGARADAEERAQALRARARALLGREPGEDVASELRAHLVDPPARAAYLEELSALLHEEGYAELDDVIGRARAFIATPPSVHVPQPPTWAMLVAGPEVPLREVEGFEHELASNDERLEALEREAARLAGTQDADLLRLGPDDFVRVVGALFDAYRAGEVLEGHLPLVLDGVLDGLAADARDAAVLALARIDDAQVIVVTDDAGVTSRIREAGGTIVQWPVPEGQWHRETSG